MYSIHPPHHTKALHRKTATDMTNEHILFVIRKNSCNYTFFCSLNALNIICDALIATVISNIWKIKFIKKN